MNKKECTGYEAQLKSYKKATLILRVAIICLGFLVGFTITYLISNNLSKQSSTIMIFVLAIGASVAGFLFRQLMINFRTIDDAEAYLVQEKKKVG